jgi:(2R)-3-sulfolactate dehydrogenase (NADP+)
LRVAAARVAAVAEAGLVRRGVPAGDAATVAACLVDAELEGRESHGMMRLPFLLRRLDAGLINPRPEMRLRGARRAAGLLDADNALGPVAGMRAASLAAGWARESGVGVVAVRRSNHLGALAYYVRGLAVQGLVGLCFSNTPAAVAPPGGARALVGTNPIAAGFPAGGSAGSGGSRGGAPIVVDMATTQGARGKILAAHQAGATLPEGLAVDASGRPTTDPEAALAGSLAPLGGPKGFALAIMVELLTGVLAGAGVGPEVTGTFAESDRESDVGHSVWALDPSTFGPGFEDRAATLARWLSDAGGRMPGDRALAERTRREREGVEVADTLAAELEPLTGEALTG